MSLLASLRKVEVAFFFLPKQPFRDYRQLPVASAGLRRPSAPDQSSTLNSGVGCPQFVCFNHCGICGGSRNGTPHGYQGPTVFKKQYLKNRFLSCGHTAFSVISSCLVLPVLLYNEIAVEAVSP